MAKITYKSIMNHQFEKNDDQSYKIQGVEQFRNDVGARYKEVANETRKYYDAYEQKKEELNQLKKDTAPLKNELAQAKQLQLRTKQELKKYRDDAENVSNAFLEVSRLKKQQDEENEKAYQKIVDEATKSGTDIIQAAEDQAALIISKAHERIKKDEDQSAAYINDLQRHTQEKLSSVAENNKMTSTKVLDSVMDKSNTILSDLYNDSVALQKESETHADKSLELFNLLTNVAHELNQFIDNPALLELAKRVQGRDNEQRALSAENEKQSEEIEDEITKQMVTSDEKIDKIEEDAIKKIPAPREIKDEENIIDIESSDENKDAPDTLNEEWADEDVSNDVQEIAKTLNITTESGEDHQFNAPEVENTADEIEDEEQEISETEENEEEAGTKNNDTTEDDIATDEESGDKVKESTSNETEVYETELHEVTRDDNVNNK